MNSRITKALLAVAILAVVLAAGILIGRRSPVPDQTAANGTAPRQQAARPATPTPSEAGVRDPYQRSLAIYEFKKAAQSGPDRGREIFYYKCWFCHNEFAGPQSAPDLKTVFQRKQLLSGRPTTEDGVKEEIREGGAGMAAYKYTLNDADINDLVSYLKSDCCWNSESPPSNPNFRGAGDGLTQ
jgi:mono/diheme cytochrome c family protein